MKDTGKNMWLENLPRHSPSEDLWNKIEARLDQNLAGERFQQQLAGLPDHQPPFALWSRIEQQLARNKVFRIGYITASIAATLLLAFMLRGLLIPEVKKNATYVAPGIAKTEKSMPIEKTSKEARVEFSTTKKEIAELQFSTVVPADFFIAETVIVTEANTTAREFDFIAPLKMLRLSPGNGLSSPEMPVLKPTTVTNSYTGSDTLRAWLLARNADKTAPPPLPKIAYQPKGFSLGLEYLPEPVSNPQQGSSLYHTFGLLAQYQAPAIEFRSGIGISYYSIPADYSAQYLSFSNTSTGYDTIVNYGDTLFGLVDGIGGINIYGSEQSRFFNYSLGAGKRIYSRDRFSATLQVGAGFSLLLSESDNLQGSTYEALKKQGNTYFNTVESNIPEINRSRFNLLTGFDVNYRLLKKWSISIEPILKYYFDPIYNGRNSKTFSTGVRTGILFKL